MSTISETVNGVGFSTYNIDETNVIRFLVNHKNANVISKFDAELTKMLKKVSSPDELTDEEKQEILDITADYEPEYSGNTGYNAMIADIMTEETGVNFEWCSDGDTGDEAILFSEKYPWNFNDKEHSLTFDGLKEIIFPYAKELGTAETIDDVDCETVEIIG